MPSNLISTKIVCAYSIDQKRTLSIRHRWVSFLTVQIFQPIKILLHLLLGLLCRNMIHGAVRMQFWHSKFRGGNEFLKYIFRLWWVRTKQTQQVTVQAWTVRAMVPWSLPHHPLGPPAWNFSRQSSSCREAFQRFLMAHPKRVFPWWRWLWHVPCSKQSHGLVCSWQMGKEVCESGGKWELRHLRAPQVTFVTGWTSWTWAAFPWAGKYVLGWAIGVCGEGSPATTQEGSRKRGLIPGSVRNHPGSSLPECCYQERQNPHKSNPKLPCCWGWAPVFGKQQHQCFIPQHSPPCR